jgi:membrane protein YqaA with SNARE-associated domain
MKRFIDRLRPYTTRPWFLPLCWALAFIDVFVLFIPTEALIFILTMMRPKRWVFYGLTIAIASSFGALALGGTVYLYGETFVSWIMGPNFLESDNWARMDGWIDHYGFWGLWFIALGPLPQQPAIMIGALAKLHLFWIFLGVLLGRAPKYALLAYLSTKGSDLLDQLFGSEITEAKESLKEKPLLPEEIQSSDAAKEDLSGHSNKT